MNFQPVLHSAGRLVSESVLFLVCGEKERANALELLESTVELD